MAFHLGNFINMGTFYSHYEKHERTCDIRGLMDARSKLERDDRSDEKLFGGRSGGRQQQPPPPPPLNVNFEHDRNVFRVRFAAQQRFNGQLEWYVVTLAVRYESIRRIVVDPYIRLSPTDHNKRLYLFINYPPQVHRLEYSREKARNRRYDSDGDRWTFWHDDLQNNWRNAPSALALKDCPVLALQFPGENAVRKCTYHILIHFLVNHCRMYSTKLLDG